MNTHFNPQSKITETLVIDFPIMSVINASVKVAKSEKGFKLKEYNALLKRVTVITKMSLFSYGEILTLQFADLDNRTQLTISSELKTSIGSQNQTTQATIGRKNKKNIDNFLNAISKYL